MGASKVGKTLGNFRILECLGSGGAGMIWKAEDLALGRCVALKELRPELAADGEMAERFRAEARTLARLSHPNVASLYSLIEDDDGIFLVLEYVEGSTFAALLTTSGPLPFDTAFALFHQVLDGVGHAHEAGIVHRDLKPANLMVDARGRVKVMDFGIARIAGAARTTHHGKLIGTPEYMSPEQVRGEDATIRSDIYSLGIVLYEMVTGRAPFRAPASFDLMRAQLEEAPADPRTLRTDLDARVANALLRALAKAPALRFGTTRELQDYLLDAGASRRGREFVPVWNGAQLAGPSSASPTLASFEVPATPLADTAVGAAEGALDEAITETTEIPANAAASRAAAPATRVIDASQDTALFEPDARALEGAQLAARVRALGRAARGSKRSTTLLLAAGLIAALALAVGVLRTSRMGNEASPEAARAPTEAGRAPPTTAVAMPELDAPERETLRSAPGDSQAERAPEGKRARVEKQRAPETQPATQEDSGWVIRR